jgi:hypothetical protein
MARVNFRVPSAGVKPDTKVLLTSNGSDIGDTSGDLFNQAGALKFHNGSASKTVAFTDSNITGTAAAWTTGRTVTFATGDVTGSFTIDGTANVGDVALTIAANSVALGTDTTGNYVATVAGTTNQVSVSGSGTETAAVTLSLPQDIHTGASPTFTGLTLSGDLAVNGADITTTETGTATVFNTNATTLNIGGAATTVSIGASTGTTTVNNALTVTGNLTVNGTTTTVNSTTLTTDDIILTLGGDTAPSSDDDKDRGIEFRWHNGSTAKVGFFGFDDSTGKFTFIPDATNSSEVFSGTKGVIDVGTVETSTLFVDSIEVDTTGATTSQVLQYNGTKFAPATLGGINSFSTIAVSGQSNVEADSGSDTLTFSAGTGITITTNATTDTVDIANAGVTQVTGTSNQISTTAGTGSITLSLPQDIATTSTPTFGALFLGDASDPVKKSLDDIDSATTTTTSATSIKTVSATDYRSVEYVVQAVQGTNYMVTKLLAIHDGSNVSFTEYGTVVIGSAPASFDVDINSGNIRLTATPASSSSTVFRVRSMAIAA